MVKQGDWVCYFKDGQLVYGKVEYITERAVLCKLACTTAGAVPVDSILEVRREKDDE